MIRISVTDLKPGQVYIAHARSLSSEENSEWSPGLVFTTPGDSATWGGGFYGAYVYVQPNEPLGVPIGTLWFDTDDFSV